MNWTDSDSRVDEGVTVEAAGSSVCFMQKTMARFENFSKFVARARFSQFWVSVTFDL